VRRLVPLLVVGTGCKAILGIPGEAQLASSSDAPPLAPADAPPVVMPDAPPAAPPDASPNTVFFTATQTNFLENGTVAGSTPLDLATMNITARAYVPNSGTPGGYDVRTGQNVGGQSTIDGVPFGSMYLLRLDVVVAQFFLVDTNVIHFDEPALGRVDTVLTTKDTPLRIQGTGLDSYAQGDTITISVPNVGVGGYAGDNTNTGSPMTGDTTLDLTVNWRPAGHTILSNANAPLITSADRIVVAHTTQKTAANTAPYNAMTETMTITGFNQTDGAAGMISGSFSNLANDHRNVTIKNGSFLNYANDVFPGATVESFVTGTWGISAQPGDPGQQHFFGGQASMASGFIGSTTGDFALGDVAFAHFPDDWGRYYGATINVVASVPVPGTALSVQVTGGISVTLPLKDDASLDIVPILSPPRNLALNGKSLKDGQTFSYDTKATPLTLSWDAPTLGTPDFYEITIVHGRLDMGQIVTDTQAILWVPTRLGVSSIAIPWDAFAAGAGVYALTVQANNGKPDTAHSNLPVPYVPPFATADALSNAITLQ
jgi:hypothetical protein